MKYTQSLQGLVVGMVSILRQQQCHNSIKNEFGHVVYVFLRDLSFLCS
jgi:hypothetical protein